MNFINKLIEVINSGESSFLNDMMELIDMYYKNSKNVNNKSCSIGLDIHDGNVPSGNTGDGNKALLSGDKETKPQKDDLITILNEFKELSDFYHKSLIKRETKKDDGVTTQSKEGKITIKKPSSKDAESTLNQILAISGVKSTPKDEKLHMNRDVPDTDYLITKILMTLGFDNTVIDNIRIRALASHFISRNNVTIDTRINDHEFLFRFIEYMFCECYSHQDFKVILRQACMYCAILLHKNNKISIETSADSRENVTVIFGGMRLKYNSKDYNNFIEAIGTTSIYTYRYMKDIIFNIPPETIKIDDDYWINSRTLMLNSSTIYGKLKELHDVFYKKDTLLVDDIKPILLTIYRDLIIMIGINKYMMEFNECKIKEITDYYGYQHKMNCPILQAIINEFVVITNYKLGSINEHIDVSKLMSRLKLYDRLF